MSPATALKFRHLKQVSQQRHALVYSDSISQKTPWRQEMFTQDGDFQSDRHAYQEKKILSLENKKKGKYPFFFS
jgi:hypothetical protein